MTQISAKVGAFPSKAQQLTFGVAEHIRWQERKYVLDLRAGLLIAPQWKLLAVFKRSQGKNRIEKMENKVCYKGAVQRHSDAGVYFPNRASQWYIETQKNH